VFWYGAAAAAGGALAAAEYWLAQLTFVLIYAIVGLG
jgi:branched-chain amino acid transport system permease protein